MTSCIDDLAESVEKPRAVSRADLHELRALAHRSLARHVAAVPDSVRTSAR
jgi:hypothetical protein